MFVHMVFFWLKDEYKNEQQQAAFRKGVESLLTCSSVHSGYVGTPASTDRPIIDTSYDLSLVVILEDLEAHDAYQVDQIHLNFIDGFKDYWEKVVIYDAD